MSNRLRKRGVSLAIYAALAFALIIALIGMTFAMLAGGWAREGVEHRVARDLTDLAAKTVKSVDSAYAETQSDLAVMTGSLHDHQPANFSKCGQYWVYALKYSPLGYSAVTVADAQGRAVAASGNNIAVGSDLSRQQWFQQSQTTSIVFDQTGGAADQPNIVVASPVKDALGNRLGTLAVQLGRPWIETLLQSRLGDLPTYMNAQVFVLDAHNQPIVSLPHTESVAFPTTALRGSAATDTVVWPDQRAYITAIMPFAPVPGSLGPPWHVVVRRSYDEVMIPALRMRDRIFLTAGILTLIGALLGGFLANRVSLPLRLIARAADRISAGDLEVGIPSVVTSSEVSMLSESLRSMVSSLRYNEARLAIMNESLEQRVLQRTAEIARAHNDLVVQETRLRAVIETAIDGVLILDAQGRVEMFNQACERIFGWSATEIRGRPVETLVSDDLFIQRNPLVEDGQPVETHEVKESAGYTLTVRGRRRDGSSFPLEVSISHSSMGGILFHVAIVRDITDAVEAREQLYAMATEDSLTGARNRRYFLEGTEMEFARTKRHDRDFSFLLIDADHFKSINDTFGHAAGDVVLRRIADLCSTNVREVDLVGRLGGEEFGIAMPEASLAVARVAAERLRQTIAETSVETPAGIVRFTVSIGVASRGSGFLTLDELTRHADDALYQAKAAGRNKVVVAQPPALPPSEQT